MASTRAAVTSSAPRFGRTAAFLLFICILSVATAYAQFDTGTITGLVTDPTGAVVPGAKVTVTNTGTGIEKTYTSDSDGNFVASALPYGSYVVSASSSGFTATKSAPLALSVGATVKVKLAMTVAGSEQTVEVTGTAATVDTTSSTSGTTLTSTQIANLPINGRDVNNFLNIAPGSVGSTGFFQGSVNGLENIFTGLNIKVDGQTSTRGDISGFLNTEGQEGARVTRASVDSIQEINFSNNGYTAETGHSLGPQMNIITKSGTNSYHGSVFEYLRNEALDARDYFDTAEKKNPLRLNQFGANLAGPIIKNKLFFFVNYEGARTHTTKLVPLNKTLSAFARSQLDPTLAPLLAALPALPANCNTIPAPASCAYGPSVGGNNPATQGANLVYLPAALPTTVREDTGSVRLDYNISDADRLMFRYNLNDSLTNYTYGLNLGQLSPQALRTQLAKIEETHTFSPTLLNQFGISITRFHSQTDSNTGGDPLVGFAGFFTDLGSLPGPNTFNQVNANTLYELSDGLTKQAGRHSLHFGTEIRVNRLNTALKAQQSYQYASFGDLFANQPFVLSKIGFPGFLGLRNSNWDFYFQDNWRVNSKLTLNLGLRYDYNTVWSEGKGHQRNFDFATQSFLPTGESAYEAPKNDFAPRVGFAYDLFGNGKTAIKGYAGLFYLPMQFSLGLPTNIPEFSNYNVTLFDAIFANPPYSIRYPSPNPPSPLQNVTIFPTNPKDPYSTNWLIGVEQELFRDTILAVNYTGNKTQHMQAGIAFAAINLNPQNPNPAVGTRPHAGFASENFAADKLASRYDALQVQVRHHRGPLQVEANYTYASEHDNLVNVFSSFSNPFDPASDWSYGDIDVRHNLTASMVYTMPALKGQNGLVRGVLGGWQTSSIFQTRSGLPTNITLVSGFFGNPVRPNFVSGQQGMLSDVTWPSQSFNFDAFQVPGTYSGAFATNPNAVPRNFLRGPGFFQWDLSLAKNFAVTEKLQLQFRTDLFNILNHPNFANPDGGICTAVEYASGPNPTRCAVDANTGLRENPTFGRSTSTVANQSGGVVGNGAARQAQFSLKLLF
jgi:hypothetical protein